MAKEEVFTKPDPILLAAVYSGNETLKYRVTWLGLPAGEVVMRVGEVDGGGGWRVEMTARSTGLLGVLYPVEDRFEILLHGERRLPVRMLVDQKEGARKNKKEIVYDQAAGTVRYQKNQEPLKVYEVGGVVHNEFSGFLYLRVLDLADRPLRIPTFADKKRHLVEVLVEGEEDMDTILGETRVVRVRPHLGFSGLYRKVGDPLVWLTDDPFRIPVKIKVKIAIGSVTGTLVEYQGSQGHFVEQLEAVETPPARE